MYQRNAISGEFLSIKAMVPFSLRSILLCIYPFDVVAEISVTLFETLVRMS